MAEFLKWVLMCAGKWKNSPLQKQHIPSFLRGSRFMILIASGRFGAWKSLQCFSKPCLAAYDLGQSPKMHGNLRPRPLSSPLHFLVRWTANEDRSIAVRQLGHGTKSLSAMFEQVFRKFRKRNLNQNVPKIFLRFKCSGNASWSLSEVQIPHYQVNPFYFLRKQVESFEFCIGDSGFL